MSTPFVVVFGITTVFVGLAVIILLCKLMSFFVMLIEKEPVAQTNAPTLNTPSPASTNKNSGIENKGSIIAAIASVVAEELGTDISNIRIHSIKKV